MSRAFQIDQMGFEQAKEVFEEVFDNINGNGNPADIARMYWYLKKAVADLERDIMEEPDFYCPEK